MYFLDIINKNLHSQVVENLPVNSSSRSSPQKNKQVDPSEEPMTSKLATWQKVSTPAKGASTSTKVQLPQRQMTTPLTQKPPLPKPVSNNSNNNAGWVLYDYLYNGIKL